MTVRDSGRQWETAGDSDRCAPRTMTTACVSFRVFVCCHLLSRCYGTIRCVSTNYGEGLVGMSMLHRCPQVMVADVQRDAADLRVGGRPGHPDTHEDERSLWIGKHPWKMSGSRPCFLPPMWQTNVLDPATPQVIWFLLFFSKHEELPK